MRVPLAPQGLPFIAVGVVATAAASWAYAPLAWFLGAFTLFTVYFFRDPERVVPTDGSLVLSPADGTIIDIRETDEPLFCGGPMRRISIFMSVTNVHVNRSPLAGRLVFEHYNPGTFELAWREKASELNEQRSMGIVAGGRKYLVKQIAGYVARRIVPYVRPECDLAAGQRIGMIRFGSRVDLFVPIDAVDVRVEVGQKVHAGLTVIGALR